MKEKEMFYIFKIPMEKILKSSCDLYETEDEAILNGELVAITSSQLTAQIEKYLAEHNLCGYDIKDVLVNIVIPAANGRKAKSIAAEYGNLARTGFNFNGRHFVRLCAGSGQLRQNTISFIWDTMKDDILEALCCGITPADLKSDFNVSKWNAYVGLSESGMHFLSKEPRVCVIEDFEKIKPHCPVDYIETVTALEGRKRRTSKTITRVYYDDEGMNFAPLNSFDGQGLADPQWMVGAGKELELGYTPSEVILRAPWIKGLLVAFDFKAYLREHGVTQISDIFGDIYNVEDLDLLISRSQFKMSKAYAKLGGWSYYLSCMKKYGLRWGVVFANKQFDDEFRNLNYQYIQSLNLSKEDIDELCAPTEKLLTDLCSGQAETVYNTLVGSYQNYAKDDSEIQRSSSLLQKALMRNPELMKDCYIETLIRRECQSMFDAAKIGKLLCRGTYSFLVSDPVGQMQGVILNHAVDGDKEITVTGLIPGGSIYSVYWNKVNPVPKNVILMRSPCIDSSEAVTCTVADTPEMRKWYSHIQSGLILSIHDLNTLNMQNCDFDGDRAFTSDSDVLIRGAEKNPVPILYPSAGAQLKEAINLDSQIAADERGLNSAVGSLSNLATGMYALRAKYDKDSDEYKELSFRIKIIGELTGVEIDKIKTGVPPAKPSDWTKEKIPMAQYADMGNDGATVKVPTCSKEEQLRILKHNALIDDHKPYFMRYIYPALDRDIKSYDAAYDSMFRFNYGVRLADLLAVDFDDLDERYKKDMTKYYSHLPVIDSPCTMNIICRKFEALQSRFKNHKSGARNMLSEFKTEHDYDEDILKRVYEIVDIYNRQRRFLTKSNVTDDGGAKRIAKRTREQMSILNTYSRGKVLELVGGDIQSAFDYLVELVEQGKCPESTVWTILDDMILLVISKTKFNEEAI